MARETITFRPRTKRQRPNQTRHSPNSGKRTNQPVSQSTNQLTPTLNLDNNNMPTSPSIHAPSIQPTNSPIALTDKQPSPPPPQEEFPSIHDALRQAEGLMQSADRIAAKRYRVLGRYLVLALNSDDSRELLDEEASVPPFDYQRFVFGFHGLLFNFFTPLYAPLLLMLSWLMTRCTCPTTHTPFLPLAWLVR